MQLKTLLLTSLLSLFSISAMASGSHNHDHGHSHGAEPVSQATAKMNAIKEVASLVSRKKLASSWADVKVASADKKIFKGKEEWLITFVNSNASDKNKQKLFVFLTLSGEYIAANFSGN